MKRICTFLCLTVLLFVTAIGQEGAEVCANAVPIACGNVLSGDTDDNSSDTAPDCPAGFINTNGEGVWYAFTGTGDDVIISLCGSEFDSRLRVFTGSCGTLVCEAGNDDFCGDDAQVNFTSVISTTYYILVYGRQGGNNSGPYTISVTCTPPPGPANETCANAIAVTCGSTTTGTTVNASADTEVICGTTDGVGGGVWYSFLGTGDDITASLCTNTAYDSKIRVFTGGCGALVCEAGNDDFCTTQSEVNFNSVNGTTYYILVHGSGANEGAFELILTCTPPATPGQECTSAIPIGCGDTDSGTTVGATPATEPFCGTGDGTGGAVWYEFIGTGDQVLASLCTNTDYDSKLRVFTGLCGALVCEVGDDDFCGDDTEVTFTSVLSTTYYILVHGFSANEGNYELAITCTSLGGPGTDCTNPIAVNAGSLPYADLAENTGSYGDIYSTSPCSDNYMDGDEAVYTYTAGATDEFIDISAIFTDIWGGIHVLDDCPDVATTCIASDLAGTATTAAIPCLTVPAGTTYFIVVSTFPAPQTIGYDLSITACTPGGPGSDCTNPIALNAGSLPYAVVGENTGNYGDNYSTSPCSDFYIGGDEVVYTYTAGTNEELIDISTTFANTWGGIHVLDDCPNVATNCIASVTSSSSGTKEILCLTVPAGATYYIVLSTFPSPQTTGYDLTISACTPPGDVCIDAQPITCNQNISGNSGGASANLTGLSCTGVSDGTGGGLWYVLTGTGEDVTASLCGDTFDPRLRIFTGTPGNECNTLACFAGNNDLNDCSLDQQSEVTFTSVLGTQYYILVDGATATDVGDFTLSISCFSPNQGGIDCDNATLVTCNNTYVGDTSLDTVADTPPVCDGTDNGTGGGVWHTFNGNGDYITASLCGSFYDTRIRVYEGTCGLLTCVVGNDDYGGCAQTNNSQVSFQSVNGTTYYIYVSGSGAAEGQYYLSLTCNSQPFTSADCGGAPGTCSSILFTPPATDAGNYSDLNSSNQGCMLGGEHRTKWYYIRTLPGAELPNGNGDCLLEFTITTGATTDYDFAVWGPYSSNSNACQGIASGNTPARCSFSATNGDTGLDSSISGGDITEGAGGNKWVDGILADGEEIYVICIDNWSQDNVAFGLEFGATSDCLDCIVLPIELLSFSGYAIEGKNVLEWSTALEINNNYFTIERSPDSFDFHPIGTVGGAGNSSQPMSYSMVDDNPLPGTNYYRLKQTDFDGSSETFHTIAIDTDDPIQEFTLFPNPGSDIITIISSAEDVEQTTLLTIRDARGFSVEQFTLSAQNMRFDASVLATGMYLVEIRNDRTSEAMTFIKR